MEITATPTATAPTTGAADTAGTVTTVAAAGIGTPTDVAAVLARLTQVTDQLAATIHTHTSGNGNGNDSDSDSDSDGESGVRVGMPTAGAILTATDRLTATVVTVLADMPTVRELFSSGDLS